MTKKVFLTGGTGFIGQPLARALLRRGWQVTVLVRRPESPQAQALFKMGARLVKGDVTDREAVLAGMQGADTVIHNAGMYEIGVTREEIRRMRDANVKGTDIVLGVAHELGIENNVYVSSIVALGDTGKQLRDETYERQAACVSAYEQSKTDAHAVALNYIKLGLPLVIVLPGTVIGVNDHSPWGYFARLYVNRIMPPISWAREAIFTHAHVEDTAEGIALAAEKGRPGEMYLLAGERITMGEAMAMWCETPGGSRFRLWVPIWLASLMFWPLEPLQRWVGLPAFISRETATGARIDYCFSSEKAKRELGWAPRPARQGWMETMQAERQLQARRNGGGLVSRLNPLDDLHLHGWHAAHSQQAPLGEQAPPEQAV